MSVFVSEMSLNSFNRFPYSFFPSVKGLINCDIMTGVDGYPCGRPGGCAWSFRFGPSDLFSTLLCASEGNFVTLIRLGPSGPRWKMEREKSRGSYSPGSLLDCPQFASDLIPLQAT